MEGPGYNSNIAALGQRHPGHVAAEPAAVDVVTADERQLAVQAVNIGI